MSTSSTPITKDMRPLHYAMYDIYGPAYGTFPVYINTNKGIAGLKEYQDVNSAIRAELPLAKLTVSITNPDNVIHGDERLYFIPGTLVDNTNGKIYTNKPHEPFCHEVDIDIHGLNSDIIPLIRYADRETGIIPTDKVPESILARLYRAIIKPENPANTVPGAAEYSKLDYLATFKPLAEQIRANPEHVQFRLQLNIKPTPYDTELDKVTRLDTHALYPAVESGKRAMLSDGRCKAFGCEFTGSELEIKEHLRTSPECHYIDYYAASHSKLASKASVRDYIKSYITKEDIDRFQRKDGSKFWFMATYKTISGPVTVIEYTCASTLCDFKCDTLHKLMEHYRLLGARGPALDEYYKTHPTALESTTEAENREFMYSIVQPDDKTPKFMLIPVGVNVSDGNVDKEVEKLREQLANSEAKCVWCNKARPNAVLPECGHVDLMCFDCRMKKTSWSGHWHCYACYGTQYCRFVIKINS